MSCMLLLGQHNPWSTQCWNFLIHPCLDHNSHSLTEEDSLKSLHTTILRLGSTGGSNSSVFKVPLLTQVLRSVVPKWMPSFLSVSARFPPLKLTLTLDSLFWPFNAIACLEERNSLDYYFYYFCISLTLPLFFSFLIAQGAFPAFKFWQNSTLKGGQDPAPIGSGTEPRIRFTDSAHTPPWLRYVFSLSAEPPRLRLFCYPSVTKPQHHTNGACHAVMSSATYAGSCDLTGSDGFISLVHPRPRQPQSVNSKHSLQPTTHLNSSWWSSWTSWVWLILPSLLSICACNATSVQCCP